jgi:hypothetical protein
MLPTHPFQVSLETVIGASPMLGHRLENRGEIRQAQDLNLLASIQQESTLSLRDASQQNAFVVAPLDVLVSRTKTGVRFHIIELNGTGIGGVSNLPAEVVAPIAASLCKVAAELWKPNAILLLPVSGRENDQDPRLNKLMHEKLIFAEALSRGLADAGGSSEIVTVCGLRQGTQALTEGVATVVMGYMKELLEACQLGSNGELLLHNRPVVGAVNDRFCLNLLANFQGQLNLELFRPINGTYLAGGDKGAAYSLLDDYLVHVPSCHFPDRVCFTHADNRQQLIQEVLRWLKMNRKVVIKPHGTGIGHGIEFFLDSNEPLETILAKIDDSIRLTEEYYQVAGGAFPYTVCEFIDTDLIRAPAHRLDGHKYELRVVVYRDGMMLKACPAIVKVAVQQYEQGNAGKHNLINNITNASANFPVDGTDYMLPLCNRQTLGLLGITENELLELCRVATEYVRYAIEEIPQMEERMRRSLHSQPGDLPAGVQNRMRGFSEALERLERLKRLAAKEIP